MSEFGLDLPIKVLVIEPLGYLDMVMLEKNASLIATDSGSVQKEACFHEAPCVTLRSETEWPELINEGWNRLISPNSNKIEFTFTKNYNPGRKFSKIHGDGNAAKLAINTIKSRLV